MSIYRKKPIKIEARQLTGSHEDYDVYCWVRDNTQGSFNPDDEEFPASGISIDPDTGFYVLATLEGMMFTKPGDWIIKGIQGEFYPCKSDIFDKTYEPVESS